MKLTITVVDDLSGAHGLRFHDGEDEVFGAQVALHAQYGALELHVERQTDYSFHLQQHFATRVPVVNVQQSFDLQRDRFRVAFLFLNFRGRRFGEGRGGSGSGGETRQRRRRRGIEAPLRRRPVVTLSILFAFATG